MDIVEKLRNEARAMQADPSTAMPDDPQLLITAADQIVALRERVNIRDEEMRALTRMLQEEIAKHAEPVGGPSPYDPHSGEAHDLGVCQHCGNDYDPQHPCLCCPVPDERTYYPEDAVAHMVQQERDRSGKLREAVQEIELRTSPYRGNDQEWPLVSGINAVARKALGLEH